MKILLAACNAKYIHSNLAVYNLKSCAGKYSPQVVIKEYTINQIRDEILKDIYLEQPGCHLLFLLYLECVFCKRTGSGSEEDPPGCRFLGRRSGGVL